MKLTGLWQSISGSTIVFVASARFAELFRPQFSATILDMRVQSQGAGWKDDGRIKRNLPVPDAGSTKRAKLGRLSSGRHNAESSSIEQ